MTAASQSPKGDPFSMDWLVIAHIKDKEADDDEPAYPVAICPTCYALVTQNARNKHEDWHRSVRDRRPGLPTRYKGVSAKHLDDCECPRCTTPANAEPQP